MAIGVRWRPRDLKELRSMLGVLCRWTDPRRTVFSLPALFLAGLAVAVPASVPAWTGGPGDPVDVVQFDFWGLSIAPEPANPGDELRMVAVLTPATTSTPVPIDPANYEYTLYLHGIYLRERVANGPFIQSTYSSGWIELYADPSFNAPFQFGTANPPPLDPEVVPANFIDGELLLRFDFRTMITIFHAPSGIGTVAYTATDLRATGGSALGILQQAHMIVGWHLGGGFTNQTGTVPAGYGLRYDTVLRWENPLPVEPSTWGGIKAAFR
jgi:hypothetical protein